MPDLDNIEKITSTIYGQIVKEQDEATMVMLENYVKEKQTMCEIDLKMDYQTEEFKSL